ncbi:MAG: S8 family serine peptidase [Fimbriimonadales bacterium]|nr:S8 family serine peptidase [Fimbriimonadales bacterium]
MRPTLADTRVLSERSLACFGLLLLLVFALGGQLPAQSVPYVPGRLLVKFRADISATQAQGIVHASGARIVGEIPRIGVKVIQLPPRASEMAYARAFGQRREVQYVQLDQIHQPAQITPNDYYYPYQWHLPKISAPLAWSYTTGSSGVIIAVLDTGVDAAHPDLAAKMVPGWNFFDNNADSSDVLGHGTRIAGIAAAVSNNSTGVASVAWGCRIMPIRISSPSGLASDTTIASGLIWAADRGARVANVSYDINESPLISDAARYFQARGGVVIFAAGNAGAFLSRADDPNILHVSATDRNDVINSWSTTGNFIDLSAPGSGISTTNLGGGYASSTGTSASAPIVAGVAALILSVNPSLSGQQVQDILKRSADDLGSLGWDPQYGWGRVNAARAVNMALGGNGNIDTAAPHVGFASPSNGATVSGAVSVQVNASDNVGVASVSLYVNNTLLGTRTGAPYTFSWDTTRVSNGTYTLRVVATDAAGNTNSAQISVSVYNAPDTTPPTVSITSPANGATVGNTQSVTVGASDNRGVVRVELYLNGGLVASSNSGSATFNLNTRQWSRGAHTLQARAYDAAGNIGSSAAITVYKR